MLQSYESRLLAAQGRVEDLRKASAARNIARAVRAERRRCDIEAQLGALKEQLASLEARASSTWENQRRQAVLELLTRARSA